jgi:hypothetical protein
LLIQRYWNWWNYCSFHLQCTGVPRRVTCIAGCDAFCCRTWEACEDNAPKYRISLCYGAAVLVSPRPGVRSSYHRNTTCCRCCRWKAKTHDCELGRLWDANVRKNAIKLTLVRSGRKNQLGCWRYLSSRLQLRQPSRCCSWVEELFLLAAPSVCRYE